MNGTFKIGEVYMMEFAGTGSEQKGYRPGLIVQNNTGNMYSPNVIAVPMTTCLKKAGQPTHAVVYARDSGLPRDSMVLCENPERMSKERIGNYVTTLSDRYMSEIAEAYMLATAIVSFISPELLVKIWEKSKVLNTNV